MPDNLNCLHPMGAYAVIEAEERTKTQQDGIDTIQALRDGDFPNARKALGAFGETRLTPRRFLKPRKEKVLTPTIAWWLKSADENPCLGIGVDYVVLLESGEIGRCGSRSITHDNSMFPSVVYRVDLDTLDLQTLRRIRASLANLRK